MRAGVCFCFFFFQAEDGIRDRDVTGVQTCALPITPAGRPLGRSRRVAVKVLLPGLLATQAGGENRFEIDAPTVGAVLRALPISDLIFDETGALRGLVNVYVDKRDMRERDGLDTALEGDEEIRIVAAVAGG